MTTIIAPGTLDWARNSRNSTGNALGMLAAHGLQCAGCGTALTAWTAEHAHVHADAGTERFDVARLVPTCGGCNRRQHTDGADDRAPDGMPRLPAWRRVQQEWHRRILSLLAEGVTGTDARARIDSLLTDARARL